MRWRTVLALFAALALLATPAAASSSAASADRGDEYPASVHGVDRHATVAHVVARATNGRDRRAPEHSSSSFGVLAGSSGIAPAVAWAHLDTPGTSPTGDLPQSSRPRAPPTAV